MRWNKLCELRANYASNVRLMSANDRRRRKNKSIDHQLFDSNISNKNNNNYKPFVEFTQICEIQTRENARDVRILRLQWRLVRLL